MEVNNSTVAKGAELSSAEIHLLLQTLNMHQSYKYLPIFLFLVLIMVIGTLGNILVLYVYLERFKKTSSNYFIVSMAVFDLLACLIGLPTEMYDLLHSYTFYNAFVCKAFRYTEAVTVYGSAIILVEIAVDRYFKICRPLMMIELFKIKMMCAGAGIAAVLISLMTIPLYGIARTATPYPDVTGHDCSIEEQYRKKVFSRAYYFLLGSIFFVTLLLLSILYIRIWVEIKRRKRLVIGDIARSASGEQIPMTRMARKSRSKIMSFSSTSSDEGLSPRASSTTIRPRLKSIAESMIRFKVTRTTLVLFVVTVAFVVSYLPGIVIMVCRSSIKNLEENQSHAEEILSKLFSKFYFVNNAINPVIYSFLNINFRRRCVLLMKKMFTCKKDSRVFHLKTEKTDSQRSNKSTKTEKV